MGEKEDLVKEKIIKIEVNLDDINPQVFDYLLELLFKEGALDVYITQVIMKKSRRSFLLSVLTDRINLDKMKEMVQRQLAAGADICKLITTAQSPDDNLAVLQLIMDSPETKIVSFAMGQLGFASRVLCPLVGGDFTYASIAEGGESAPGQITVPDLHRIYGMLRDVG